MRAVGSTATGGIVRKSDYRKELRRMLWPVPSKRSHRARVEPDRFARGLGDRKRTGANRTSKMAERVAWTTVSLVLRGLALIRGPSALVHLMDIAVERRRFRVH